MPPRVELSHEALAANLRLAAYEMINAWLDAYRVTASALPVSPIALLVYLTVAVATIQRLVRGGGLSDELRAGAPLPKALQGGISRRAIADATGLPRETVRRHVAQLVAEGRLCEQRRGLVSVPPTFLEDVDAAPGLADLAGIAARLSENLLRLGVLRAEP